MTAEQILQQLGFSEAAAKHLVSEGASVLTVRRGQKIITADTSSDGKLYFLGPGVTVQTNLPRKSGSQERIRVLIDSGLLPVGFHSLYVDGMMRDADVIVASANKGQIVVVSGTAWRNCAEALDHVVAASVRRQHKII